MHGNLAHPQGICQLYTGDAVLKSSKLSSRDPPCLFVPGHSSPETARISICQEIDLSCHKVRVLCPCRPPLGTVCGENPRTTHLLVAETTQQCLANTQSVQPPGFLPLALSLSCQLLPGRTVTHTLLAQLALAATLETQEVWKCFWLPLACLFLDARVISKPVPHLGHLVQHSNAVLRPKAILMSIRDHLPKIWLGVCCLNGLRLYNCPLGLCEGHSSPGIGNMRLRWDFHAVLDDSSQTLFLTEMWRGLALTMKVFFEPKVTVRAAWNDINSICCKSGKAGAALMHYAATYTLAPFHKGWIEALRAPSVQHRLGSLLCLTRCMHITPPSANCWLGCSSPVRSSSGCRLSMHLPIGASAWAENSNAHKSVRLTYNPAKTHAGHWTWFLPAFLVNCWFVSSKLIFHNSRPLLVSQQGGLCSINACTPIIHQCSQL